MKKHTRRVVGICAMGMLAIALGALGQTKAKAHINVPVVAARAEDVGSIEAIVRADYECISGGVGVARQWARDLTLYDANARFFQVVKDTKSGGVKISSPTWQEFTDESDAEMVKGGFSEHELAHKIYRYGNVATVFSSYVGKISSTGEGGGRGVNIYQVYYAGGRWWISSISWDAERLINEIPPELQPAK
ncbi:MAG TPA: hypothetical protein VEU52_11080 [Candidatus Limnocylindrales bacterium]|nr:hypothetical protein [Candidatus Limnocylindrales bacterium]